MKKETTIHVRLEKKQKAWLESKAKKTKTTIGAWIRYLINEAKLKESMPND